MHKLYRSFLVTGLVAAGLAGCGDDVTVTPPPPPPPPPTPMVRSVTVAPTPVTIGVGGTQVLAAAVTSDAGITPAPTVAWASSSTAIATVSPASGATTTVTGVTAGTVGITATATSGTSSASGQATVTVSSNAPTVTGVTTSPAGTVAINVGQAITATATVQGTNSPAQTVNWVSLTPAVATVNPATGTNTTITGVSGGIAVIRATSTQNAAFSTTFTVQVVVPDPATISIQSVTTGGLGIPVNLAAVAGQIEVTLNVDRGSKNLDRVEVTIGGLPVASQSFGAIPSAPEGAAASSSDVVVIVQSINTRQVVETSVGSGIYIPVIFNGQKAIVGNLYVTGSNTPIASNAVPVTMTNNDGILAPTGFTASGASAVNVGTGQTWWSGSATVAGVNYLAFGAVVPTSVTIPLTAGQCGSAAVVLTPGAGQTATGGITMGGTNACAGQEALVGAVNTPIGATVYPAVAGPDATPLVGPFGYATIGSAFTIGTATRRNLTGPTVVLPGPVVTPNPAVVVPAALRIDNKAPTFGGLATVAFNSLFDQPWINGSFVFGNYGSPVDGGVGLNAAATGTRLFGGTCSGATVVNGSTLSETVTSSATDGLRVCGFAADLLANASTSGASNFFGVDKVAPSIRYGGSGAIAFPSIFTGSATLNSATNIYTSLAAVAAAAPGAPAQFGVEALDTRSGFHQGAAIAGLPATQSDTRLAPGGATCGAISGSLAIALADTWVRTVSTQVDCALGVGYYTYNATVTDRAGNVSAAIARNLAIDIAAPNLTGLGFAAALYTGGQPASFGISANDDLEIIDGTVLLDMPGLSIDAVPSPAVGIQYPVLTLNSLGVRWDGTLTNVLNGALLTVPYFLARIDESCAAAGIPYAGCGAVVGSKLSVGNAAQYNNGVTATNAGKVPTMATAQVVDVASTASGTIAAPMLVTQTTAVGEQWSAADIVTWLGTNVGGTMTLQHTASTSIVVPYFDAVAVYRLNVAGTYWKFCGLMPAPALTDNGVNRFWTYTTTTATFSGAGLPCATGTAWRGLGRKNGAGLFSPNY